LRSGIEYRVGWEFAKIKFISIGKLPGIELIAIAGLKIAGILHTGRK
jgi:hypothetical protein